MIAQCGIPQNRIKLFRNAAPPSFEPTNRKKSEVLSNLLIVSNHLPQEIQCAIEILQSQGVSVRWYGKEGHFAEHRITHQELEWADAVVSIGKTVSYAIRAEKRTYVYDIFGGPGWLNENNIHSASKFNFSGRCCYRKLSTKEIVKEITEGYPEKSLVLTAQHLEEYCLERFVDQLILLHEEAATPDVHRATLKSNPIAFSTEKYYADSVGKYFQAYMKNKINN